ncbi:hypothetical protein MRB53_037084 [Persea americana]|nr:hypothetical protein MRB53_037084 [Persea americana]
MFKKSVQNVHGQEEQEQKGLLLKMGDEAGCQCHDLGTDKRCPTPKSGCHASDKVCRRSAKRYAEIGAYILSAGCQRCRTVSRTLYMGSKRQGVLLKRDMRTIGPGMM